MTKIVINDCYGGFGLSRDAILLARKLSNNPTWGGAILKGDKYEDGKIVDQDYGGYDYGRSDPLLIQVVETLKEKANGKYAKLKIVEIPDDVKWEICENAGMEWIAEIHRTWC